MVASEVGRTPAVDGTAHILGGGDDDGEGDEEESRVAVVQPVNNVVIVTYIDLDHLGYGRY